VSELKLKINYGWYNFNALGLVKKRSAKNKVTIINYLQE